MPETYVHNGIEVVTTGRTAHKKIEGRGRRVASRIDLLHEITPADAEQGSWKKWVRKEELYQITENNNNDDTTLS